MRLGGVRICRVQLVQRPRARLQLRGPVLVPLKTTSNVAVPVQGKSRWGGGRVVEEHDVVVAARSAVAAPLGAGEDEELALLVDGADERERRVPPCGGDVEVVGGVADDVEAGDLLRVAEVVRAAVGADGVVGVDVQIGEEHSWHGRAGGNGDCFLKGVLHSGLGRSQRQCDGVVAFVFQDDVFEHGVRPAQRGNFRLFSKDG